MSTKCYTLTDVSSKNLPMTALLYIAALMAIISCISYEAAVSKGYFEDNFSIMWSENHFKTSEDGQIWYLSLDKETCMHFYCWLHKTFVSFLF